MCAGPDEAEQQCSQHLMGFDTAIDRLELRLREGRAYLLGHELHPVAQVHACVRSTRRPAGRHRHAG